MLNKLRKNDNDGFTIIEVMIVLAIAALILLVVLLAVPALQKSSRNTTIKSDASSVAAGVSTFETDNNGTAPATTAAGYVDTNGSLVLSNTAAGATPETTKIQAGDAFSVVAAPSGTSPTNLTNAQMIEVDPGYNCSTATGGSGNASPSNTAIYYTTEVGSTIKVNCVDS